jgi:poly-gamma-glutamate synthesis protein (capsule biosynthesis protein)
MESQLIRYGPEAPWEGLEPLLETVDLAVGNLESVLSSQGQPMDKGYLIRTHPFWGTMLTAGGLGVVSVSNNHALDYGQAGLDDTLSTLNTLGVRAVGAAPSDDSGLAHRPAQIELNGVQVALLGYAAARWKGSEDMPATDHVSWAEPETVRADVEAARVEADFVVVVLHAGTEYAPEPSPDQIAVARAAIDAGAGLVVGHHPHVTQTVERYKQGLIVYSLGDAVLDIPRPAAMRGHLLRVLITKGGLSAAELWPFWIEDALRPRLLDSGDGTPRVETIFP